MNGIETKPLSGRGVVITRPEKQSGELTRLLSTQGARVINFPVIQIAPPADWSMLDRAIEKLESYRWIIFTSANGVVFFFGRLREQGKDIRELKGVKIAAIGPATAAAIEALGIKVDLMPDEFVSEGVVKAFAGRDLQGCSVLLPRAQEARDVIPAGLAKLGATVEVATVYRTISTDRDPSELIRLFEDGEISALIFTSGSTVVNFMKIMGVDFHLPSQVKVATIGPVTEAAAEKAGLPVHIRQKRATVPELVDALTAAFAG
ncbi:MAG: uroporphyrinogen-III synthase [Syntrophales bacterium]|nr:uroporphyrinogen-III synthase [Syntrophales bacterium]